MTDRREYFKQYKQTNKERIKAYEAERYQQKKEEIAKQQKQYREANREKINAYRSEQVICDVCGANVSRRHLARHCMTIKCIKSEKRTLVV